MSGFRQGGATRPLRPLRRRPAEFGLALAGRLVRMPEVPALPAGRLVELPGRGRTFVLDTGADDGVDRPPLVLLHALACTGLLAWYPCLDALRRRYRVVVFDQRWHGQGIRAPGSSLDDCADDVAAVADLLGLDTFVTAGYSMGSLVAQLTWRRHRERVQGLVLCSGATHIPGNARGQAAFTRLGRRLALGTPAALAAAASDEVDDQWAWRQFRSTTSRDVVTAAAEIAHFDSRPWINRVDVPTAVVVTTKDRVISPVRQRALAAAIPQAAVYDVPAGHAACVLAAERFRPAMLAATASVVSRISAAHPS